MYGRWCPQADIGARFRTMVRQTDVRQALSKAGFKAGLGGPVGVNLSSRKRGKCTTLACNGHQPVFGKVEAGVQRNPRPRYDQYGEGSRLFGDADVVSGSAGGHNFAL